jgi:helicase
MTAPPELPGSLTPPQQEVLDCGLLHTGFDCLLQMPTGSGKTWLAEHAIAAVLAQGRRAIYLTPLRALAAELAGRWQGRFAPHAVGVFTGDYGAPGRPFPVSFHEARLLVMTPERLDACTRCWHAHWGWIPEVDLVVVDEFHLLGAGLRGARLEGTLARIRRLNPFLRLLGLSATLGNRAELADWLGAVEHGSTWRPVPLRWQVVRYRKAGDKPELLREVVQRNVQVGGKSLVFVQSRRRAEETCRALQAAGLRAAHHHAGLGPQERGAVEDAFRAGAIEALVATATLEMGLNLPVRQVVLYDLQAFDGSEFRPLSCCSVWQRAGRAGRPGLDTHGEVVLLAASWDRQAARYADGEFEPVRSGLADARALAEQVLAEVCAGLARTPAQLGRVFAASLAARQGRLPEVGAIVRAMCDAGMLAQVRAEEEGEPSSRLKATRLGRVAVRHFLAPATVLLFRRLLDRPEDWTFFDLLLTASCSSDCEPVLPADYEELESLAGGLAQEPSLLLQRNRVELAELLEADGKRLLAALKTALAARTWTRTGDAEHVAEALACYPFEVRRLCESMERLLTAMLASVEPEPDATEPPVPDDVPLRERLRVLQRMVAGGLDEETVTLTLVAGIGPMLARRLRSVGIVDIEALAQSTPDELGEVRGLSAQRAARWINEATRLVGTHSAWRYRETGPGVALPAAGWPPGVEPYRLRRALELQVGSEGSGDYRVSGGLEPHRVRLRQGRGECDCPDAAAGNTCKHVLAVRLKQGDAELHALVERLQTTAAPAGLDLFDLWFRQGRGAPP